MLFPAKPANMLKKIYQVLGLRWNDTPCLLKDKKNNVVPGKNYIVLVLLALDMYMYEVRSGTLSSPWHH